jgi:hypothetical protein
MAWSNHDGNTQMGKMNDMANILFREADLLGCPPRHEGELARLCGWTKPNVWNYFGPSKDHPPKDSKVLEKVCAAFNSVGIAVRPKWFELSKAEFAKKVRDARTGSDGKWVTCPAYNADIDLSELSLHVPTPMNEPGTYFLSMTLQFDRTTRKDYSVVISLKEADLTVESTSYQLALFDDDQAINVSWKRVSGGAVRFTAPLDPGYLEGNPFGQQKPIKIEHIGAQQEHEVVTATVRLPLFGFALVPVIEEGCQPPRAAKEVEGPARALLNAFIL